MTETTSRPSPITVVQVGVRASGSVLGAVPFRGYSSDVKVHAFEADAEQASAVRTAHSFAVEMHPYAVSDIDGDVTFYVTKHPSASSIIPFNARFADTIHGLDCETVEERVIPTRRLASVLKVPPDFMYLDAESAEPLILRGLDSMLDAVLAIRTEFEFDEIRLGQDVFGELHDYLTGRGFHLYGIKAGSPGSPYGDLSTQGFRAYGALTYGHALYCRDYKTLAADDEWAVRLFKLAAILLSYQRTDYAWSLLHATVALWSPHRAWLEQTAYGSFVVEFYNLMLSHQARGHASRGLMRRGIDVGLRQWRRVARRLALIGRLHGPPLWGPEAKRLSKLYHSHGLSLSGRDARTALDVGQTRRDVAASATIGLGRF